MPHEKIIFVYLVLLLLNHLVAISESHRKLPCYCRNCFDPPIHNLFKQPIGDVGIPRMQEQQELNYVCTF